MLKHINYDVGWKLGTLQRKPNILQNASDNSTLSLTKTQKHPILSYIIILQYRQMKRMHLHEIFKAFPEEHHSRHQTINWVNVATPKL